MAEKVKVLGDEKMVLWDDDIELGYEEPEQNILDQVNVSQIPVPSSGEQAVPQPPVESPEVEYSLGEKYRSALFAAQSPEEHDAQVKMFKAELNAKQSTLLKFGTAESGTSLTGSTLFNSVMSGNSITSGSLSGNPDITKSFVDKVQYNLETNLGPTSIARVPSVLDDWEVDNGYYLAPDEFGIDRKVKNGIMDSVDAGKVLVLRSAFEKAVHDAFVEVQKETAGLPHQEGSTKPIVSVKNEVSFLSKASYKSGYNVGINNKGNQIPEEIRDLLKPEILESMGLKLNFKKYSEVINALSADGIIVVPIKTEQGPNMISISELKRQYDKILNTTNAFERGRLEAEFFVDVYSVCGSIVSSDQIDISKLSFTSKLFPIEKLPGIRVKPACFDGVFGIDDGGQFVGDYFSMWRKVIFGHDSPELANSQFKKAVEDTVFKDIYPVMLTIGQVGITAVSGGAGPYAPLVAAPGNLVLEAAKYKAKNYDRSNYTWENAFVDAGKKTGIELVIGMGAQKMSQVIAEKFNLSEQVRFGLEKSLDYLLKKGTDQIMEK